MGSTFNQWEAQPNYFNSSQLSDPTISGPGATPQNDGVHNLLKYLFGINPAQPMIAADRVALPTTGTMTIGGNSYLTFTFGEYQLQIGLTSGVQTSPDLENWTTLNTGQYSEQPTGGVDPNGDPYMEIEIPSGGTRDFIRLDVTIP